MTPIDKAIKALTVAADQIERTAFTIPAPNVFTPELVATAQAMRLVVADLSSLKLEAGDVEWLTAQKGAVSVGRSPMVDAHNARIDHLLAFLGHGGEG